MLSEIDWNVQTLSVAGAFAIPIVAVISYYWYRATKARADAALKQTLANRGMSAHEIERVMESGHHARG